jgi:Tn3 transposase DDE domain
MLDGLLENNTVLRLREHYTDTHGFTEHIFGLCYLLGYSFMPQLRDLADQHLFKVDRRADSGWMNPLFDGTVDTDLIPRAMGPPGAESDRAGQCDRSAACQRSFIGPCGSAHGPRPRGEDDFHSALSLRSATTAPSGSVAVEPG